MAISNSQIKSEVAQLIQSNKEVDPADAEEAFAQGIADIIENALKSADVVVEAGIPVSTTGTASAQTGQTTSQGSGSLQ